MAKHSAMNDEMQKCAKAADASPDMDKMKDLHESMGEHLDMAKHHLDKAAMDCAGSEGALDQDELTKAARVEAQKKADDAEREKIEKAAKPAETKAAATETDELDFTGMTPAQIKAVVKLREENAVSKAIQIERRNTPAGDPKVRLSQTPYGAPELVDDNAEAIDDPDLQRLAKVAASLDPDAPDSVEKVSKAAGHAIGQMLSLPNTIPGAKRGKGRSVMADPNFKGKARA